MLGLCLQKDFELPKEKLSVTVFHDDQDHLIYGKK